MTDEQAVSNAAILPNALIIGVQKSATTWLQYKLAEHPDIFMAKQEIHYFDRNENFAKGPEWYSRHFNEGRRQKIRCEKTPDYIWTNCEGYDKVSPQKAQRIKDLLGEPKLIAVLRDPVERFLSAWHHNARLGRVPARADLAAVLADPTAHDVFDRMLLRGKYAEQLAEFERHFSADSIHLIDYLDVRENPDRVLREACEFLGVDANFGFSKLSERKNSYKSTQLGARLIGATDGLLRRVLMGVDKRFLSRTGLKKVSYPGISANERTLLLRYYQQDIEAFMVKYGSLKPRWPSLTNIAVP